MNFLLFLSATLIASLANANLDQSFVNSAEVEITPEDFKNVFDKNSPIQLQMDPKYLQRIEESILNNDTEILTANMNDYIEKVIANIDDLMKNMNFDPYDLPKIKESVTYHILWLIPYTGSLNLKKGKLRGASTIFRKEESIVSYDKGAKYLSIKTNIGFDSLKFSYRYHLSIPLIIQSRGLVMGGVKDLDINIAVGLNLETGLIDLEDFSMPSSGHISLSLHTFDQSPNWSLNLILNTCTAILKNYILEAISSIIKTPLETAIGTLNNIIQSILSF